MKRILLLSCLFCLGFLNTTSALAEGKIDSLVFPKLIFSPYESYNFVSTNLMMNAANADTNFFSFDKYDMIVPFGLGIEKVIIQKASYQLGLSANINTQFIFRNENSIHLDGVRKTLFNTDYYLRIFNVFRLSTSQLLRLTLFHRSSHLGDDYTLLNQLESTTYWSTDESNYEALQVQYVVDKEHWMLYAGGNLVLRTDNRERLEFHQGGVVRSFFNSGFLEKLFVGYDLKLLQNNDFKPGVDVGVGYDLNDSMHCRINYYHGNIPYSRLERQINSSWIGFGFYINVIGL